MCHSYLGCRVGDPHTGRSKQEFTVSQFWRLGAQGQGPAPVVLGFSSCPLQPALAVLRWQGGREAGRRLCSLPVLVRTLISSQGLHRPSWPHLNLVPSQGPTSKCGHVGLGFSACMWGGGEVAQYNPQHSLFCFLILS